MIPFATKYGSYWNCGCNRVLHTKDDLHKHMLEHALERLSELNEQ